MDGVCQTQKKVVEFMVKTIYQFHRTFLIYWEQRLVERNCVKLVPRRIYVKTADIQFQETKLKQVDCDRTFFGYLTICKWWGQAWFHFQKWSQKISSEWSMKTLVLVKAWLNQIKEKHWSCWWTKQATFTWNWGGKRSMSVIFICLKTATPDAWPFPGYLHYNIFPNEINRYKSIELPTG